MKPAHHIPRSASHDPESAQLHKKAFKNAQRRGAESAGVGSSDQPHGPLPALELFQKENSAASHAVRNKLTQLGLDFLAHSIPDDLLLKHEQLIRAGGKDQLPFLIDHSSGVKLYEGQAILAYLQMTYGDPGREDWVGRTARRIGIRIQNRADQLAWRVSSPILRAQRFQLEARNAMKTLEHTWQQVRKRVEKAMDEAKAKSQGAEATAGSGKAEESKAEEVKPVPAEVPSATEAA